MPQPAGTKPGLLAPADLFSDRPNAAIKMYLSDRQGGVTLKQLIFALGPKLGTWPEDTAPLLQFALYGHLLRLQQRGVVRCESRTPIEYFPAVDRNTFRLL